MDSAKPDTADEPRFLERHARWLAPTLIAVCAFACIGMRSLWEPDEGRYTAAALEMLRTGDWIHPQLNHELSHYTKPPITYWLIASSIALFGENETAARLPHAVAFFLTSLAVGAMARRMWPGGGWAAAVIYATSTLAFIAANIVSTDTILTLWVTLAALGFVRAWRRLDPEPAPGFHAGALRLMWLAFGLAFLTKGPPGLLGLLPIVAVVGWFGGARCLLRLLDPLGVIVFLAVGLSWYIVVINQKHSLLGYFLGSEVVGRIVTGEHGRNPEWYFAFMYIPVLIGGLLPWSISWIALRPRRDLAGLRTDPRRLYLALWVALPLLVFMVSSSRLPLYVVPLVAPLAILSSRLQRPDWLTRRATWAALAAFAMGLVLVRFGLAYFPTDKDARALAAAIDCPPDAQEIIFVDEQPKYGLSLYAGVSVEQVLFRDDLGVESVEMELTDGDHDDVVFVLRVRNRDRFVQALEDTAWRILEERPAKDYLVIHAIQAQDPPPAR